MDVEYGVRVLWCVMLEVQKGWGECSLTLEIEGHKEGDGIQWNLRTMDTLGTSVLSISRRLSLLQRF